MNSSRLKDWILLLLCNLIWASQFAMIKVVQAQMGPVSATFFPMGIATICLVLVVLRHRRREKIRGSALNLGDIGRFLLVGVMGQVAAQLLVTWGVKYTLASNAALLMLTLPVVTAIMAYAILGERMSGVRWLGFALAIAGVLACSGVDWRGLNLSSRQYLLGNCLVLASVCGSAFYNVYSKKLLERYTPLEVLLYSYYAAMIVLAPITVCVEPEGFTMVTRLTPAVWAGLAVLALLQYFVSMLLFLKVLARLDATQAGLSNYMIPFFGVIIAAGLLHEKLTGEMLIGGVLVLVSTLLVTVYDERRRRGTDVGQGA
jgi:drug/metabolite transporter (DMT)-like permease